LLNPIFCLKIDCIDFFILFWAEWKNLTTLCWTEQFVFVKFEIKLPDSRHLFNRFMYLYFIINVLYSLFGICKMYRGDGMKLARANGFLMKCIWLWQTQRSICWKCYFFILMFCSLKNHFLMKWSSPFFNEATFLVLRSKPLFDKVSFDVPTPLSCQLSICSFKVFIWS